MPALMMKGRRSMMSPKISETIVPGTSRLLLVIDQFEELFRYGEEVSGMARVAMREEARAFIESPGMGHLLLATTPLGTDQRRSSSREALAGPVRDRAS